MNFLQAEDISEAEVKFKEAFRIAETNYRRSQQLQHQNQLMESQHRRDTNVMIYIRRRLAMCARKLGKLKEAVKMFKDLAKEVPPIMHVLNIHENLLECLLEMGNYADVQAVLAKYVSPLHWRFNCSVSNNVPGMTISRSRSPRRSATRRHC